MKLFLSATLAIVLGIMGQAPRIYAAPSISFGSSSDGSMLDGLSNMITSGGNILGGGALTDQTMVDMNDIYQRLNIKKGTKIIVGIDSLRNLIPDSAGNVDVGPFLQHFGIGNGKYVVNLDVVRNLPTDANGKIELLTLLEKWGIGFTYGSQRDAIQVNVDDLYQKLGINKGSTITVNINNLKNLHPDSFGNVEVGPFLQLLGVGSGSYIVNYDLVRNLPTDTAGKINLLTLLGELNIGYSYGSSSSSSSGNHKSYINIDDLYQRFGFTKGRKISLKVDNLRALNPDSNGNVDIGAFLLHLGIGSGSHLVNYDVIRNLPTDSEDKIDLLMFLHKLNIAFKYGGTSTSSESMQPVNLDQIYSHLGFSKGSTITLNVNNLKHLIPDTFGNVDVGPFLQSLGISSGTHIISFDTIKSLPTDSNGNIELLTLFNKLNIAYTDPEPIKLNIDEILNSLSKLSGTNGGHTITVDVNTIKNLQPNSQNEVDLGPLLASLGFGNGGSYIINYDIIKNFQPGSSGTVDLLDLIQKLITDGGSTALPWTIETHKPNNIDINAIINQLRQNINNGVSTVTINIQNLRPDASNHVDIGPLLYTLGLGNGEPIIIDFNIVKDLTTGSSGNIDLMTLLSKLPVSSGKPTTIEWTSNNHPTNIDISAIINQLNHHNPGHTITINVEALHPNNNNQVDIGPLLAQLGLINGGSIIVNYDTIKHLLINSSGTIDVMALLQLIEKHFSSWENPEHVKPEEQPNSQPETPIWEEQPNLQPEVPIWENPEHVKPEEQPNSQPETPIWEEQPNWQPEVPIWANPENVKPEENPHSQPETPIWEEQPNWQPEVPIWANPETGEHPISQPETPIWEEQPNWQPEVPIWANPENVPTADHPISQPETPIWEEQPNWQPEVPIWANEHPNSQLDIPIMQTVNLDQIYSHLGFSKGSTITLNVNNLKNLIPDALGNVDVGPFLQSLGITSGPHMISFDIIKTLPIDSNGNIDLLTLLNKFNISYTGLAASEPIKLNIDEILNSLSKLSGTNGGHTIAVDVNTIKNLQPNSQNKVDLGPLLASLGFGNGGSYTINYDIIKNLHAGSSGTVDLLALLLKLIAGEGSTIFSWTIESQNPNIIDINVIINQLRQIINNGGSTMTINIQNLRPDANNQVDIGPLLAQLGLINGGSFMINYDTIKHLSTNTSGNIYLTALLQLIEQQFSSWENPSNVKPVEQPTTLPDIPTLPTNGNVNPGTSMPDIPTLPTTGNVTPDIPYWQPEIPIWENPDNSLPDIPMWNP